MDRKGTVTRFQVPCPRTPPLPVALAVDSPASLAPMTVKAEVTASISRLKCLGGCRRDLQVAAHASWRKVLTLNGTALLQALAVRDSVGRSSGDWEDLRP